MIGKEMVMTDNHFRQVAAQQGWTVSTQVAVLLEYIAHQDCDDVFCDFLEEKAEDPVDDPAEDFLWEVADRLQHRGLVLDADFQRFCADGFDLFTPDEAALAWRQRQAT